ncbi:hypothetical protein J4442_01890 [Candidatus Woesearchaeota archaeon]|nr:hypothetical protein [Candidatus Woesearchaeota archaeon]
MKLLKTNYIEPKDQPSFGYLLRLISFEDDVLYSRYFDINVDIVFAADPSWFDENGNQIFIPEYDVPEIKDTILEISIPYYSNAKRIEIFDPYGKKLLEIDVSSFAKMDSDGQNLDLINYGIILILIVVFFLIYKNKDRFRKEEISNTEEQLKEYIKDAKKQGQNEEEIKKELINSNWPRDLMDKYLK